MIKYEDSRQIFDCPQKINLKYVLRWGIYRIENVFYKLLMDLIHPRHCEEKKFKVSMCAIFKDEGDILREWIEYHIIVGVEHFYLYNNFSSDNYLEILDEYVQKGIVKLVDWPVKKGQMSAYEDCVKRYSKESLWIGFIDLDEFIVPTGLYTNIYDVLKKFKNRRPFVIVNWLFFGSSGKMTRDKNSLVTETFTSCWNKYSNIGKFFYNTNYSYFPKEKYTKGYMHYRWGAYKNISLPPVNIFDNIYYRGFNPLTKNSLPLQINHYVIKTYGEYVEKKAKRGGGVHDVSKGFHDNEYFFNHDVNCQSKNYAVQRFLIKLKIKLNKNE